MTYKLTDYIRFFLIYPDQTEYEAKIRNNTLTLKDTTNDTYGFAQRTLNNDLIFYNDENANFNKLYAYEKNNNSCHDIKLRIEIYDNDEWQTFWLGVIPFRSGTWNIGKCIAELTPKPDDNYRWLIENEKIEKDLFNIADRYSIDTIQGELECIEVTTTNPPVDNKPVYTLPDAPTGKGWVLTYSETITYESVYYSDPGVQRDIEIEVDKVTILQRYCREVATESVSVSEGWLIDGSKYVRPVAITAPINSINVDRSVSAPLSNSLYGGYINTTEIVSSDVVDYEADNLLKISDIIDYLLEGSGFTIVSDFLNINPDNTHPENIAYDYSDAYFQNILVSQASDIINADASQNATKFNIDFITLWENLSALMNIEMFEDNGNLRIEHVSFRQSRKTLDISQNKLLIGKDVYKYNSEDYPTRELFNFKYATGSEDFDNAKIEYDARCSNGEDESIVAKNCVTNISDIYNNTTLQDDKDKMKDTFVLIATNNNRVVNSIGAITGTTVLNSPFAFANLIESLHVHNRPQKSATMNGKSVEFITKKELKEQSGIELNMCLSEYYNKFSIGEKVKTQLGWGKIEEATYTIPFEKLEFSCMHE